VPRQSSSPKHLTPGAPVAGRPSALLDTRIIYCGDCLDQLRRLPDACADLIYIDPPFNSNRNYEVFWGETKEKRAFEDRHASTQAYIEYMRPRCDALAGRQTTQLSCTLCRLDNDMRAIDRPRIPRFCPECVAQPDSARTN